MAGGGGKEGEVGVVAQDTALEGDKIVSVTAGFWMTLGNVTVHLFLIYIYVFITFANEFLFIHMEKT